MSFHGRFNKNSGQAKFPSIKLQTKGEFYTEFYIYQFCIASKTKNQCSSGDVYDYVEFNVSINDERIKTQKYSLNEIKPQKKWLPQRINFETSQDDANLQVRIQIQKNMTDGILK